MMTSSNAADRKMEQRLQRELGSGPMRFRPVNRERSVQQEVLNLGLSGDEIESFCQVKAYYEIEQEKRKRPSLFTDTQLLRFTVFSKFNSDKALHLIHKTDSRNFHLSARTLEPQLRTKTLFPLPGLKTMDDSNVFYMRPCRYSPKKMKVNDVIDNLLYVMNGMATKHPKNGIAFVANMNDWTMAHFSTEYCLRFMQCLQGHIFPAKVNLFLIVNPPVWFDKIWSLMKPMLGKTFQKKVHMIPEDRLYEFLQEGYEQYLPDELKVGQVNVDELVEDFVAFQKAVEEGNGEDLTSKSEESLVRKPFSRTLAV